MRKHNFIRNTIMTICVISLVLGSGNTITAETFTETESNDSWEEAELIVANRQTAQNYLDADNNNSHVIKGTASKTNEDWFKIYLDSSEENYFSIYSGLVYYQIYDSDMNYVTNEIYVTDASSNYHVYDYRDLPSGYYYICIKGASTSNSYQFVFGNPIYRASSITVSGTQISLSSSQTEGSDQISIETGQQVEDAQVYEILINGILTSYTEKVVIEYSNSNYSFTKTSSWSSVSVPLSYGYGLDGRYTFTYTYKSSAKTFTPSYKLYYVYPLLP